MNVRITSQTGSQRSLTLKTHKTNLFFNELGFNSETELDSMIDCQCLLHSKWGNWSIPLIFIPLTQWILAISNFSPWWRKIPASQTYSQLPSANSLLSKQKATKADASGGLETRFLKLREPHKLLCLLMTQKMRSISGAWTTSETISQNWLATN